MPVEARMVEITLRATMTVPADWSLIEGADGVPYYFEDADGREIHPLICLDFDAQGDAGRICSTDAELDEIRASIVNYLHTEVQPQLEERA
jgi:hypothetical protein